eukprot:8024498-Prorocentrum_lima.AAC.1
MAEPDYFFDPDREEELMDKVKEDTPKKGEAEPFIEERDQLEEDQLHDVLQEVSMPSSEDKVA